jgi:hypothetical protein
MFLVKLKDYLIYYKSNLVCIVLVLRVWYGFKIQNDVWGEINLQTLNIHGCKNNLSKKRTRNYGALI